TASAHLSTGQYALSQPKVQWTDWPQPEPQKPHESSASATPCNRQVLQTARKQNPQYQKQTTFGLNGPLEIACACKPRSSYQGLYERQPSVIVYLLRLNC